MRMRQMDRALERALRAGTAGVAARKAAVWRAVASGARQIEAGRIQTDMKRKRNHLLALTGAAAAVTLATVFFSLTPQGTALAGRLIRFFAPEKQITTEIEGARETQSAQLAQSTYGETGYVMYVDTERYKKESADGTDYYKALNQPEGYPPVQMEISAYADEASVQYQKELTIAQAGFGHAEGRGLVDEPVKGWCVVAWNEGGGDAPYEETYVVEDKAGGCFVIRCRLFSEAEEGHGARFQAMLKTFEIVRAGTVATASPLPVETARVENTPGKLTWETLTLYGAALDKPDAEAVSALEAAIGNPAADETGEDAGGKMRTLKWEDGTVAVIRNGKLYSLETANPEAAMPNGLHVGLKLDEFKSQLGEPREGVNGTLTWGVGSNDNLIVTVKDSIVTSLKLSLIE